MRETLRRVPPDRRGFNLLLLRHLYGGQKCLAYRLDGVTNSKYLSCFVVGTRRMPDALARAIEERLALSPGWLDRDYPSALAAPQEKWQAVEKLLAPV